MAESRPTLAQSPWLLRIIRRLLSMYPIVRGRARFAQFRSLWELVARFGFGGSPPEVFETHTMNGCRVIVLWDDHISRMTALFGDLDPAISTIVRAVVRPGDHVVDVGANIGLISLHAASLTGSSGRISAFEPQADLAAMLRESARLNDFSHVEVFPVVLSDSSGSVKLNIRRNDRGMTRLDGDGNTVVPSRKLDEIIPNPVPTRLIKIDVEGHEPAVLRGAIRFFEKAQPDFVLIECHSDASQFWQRPEIGFLVDRQYSLHQVHRRRLGARLTRLVPGRSQISRGWDFLGVRQGLAAPGP